MFDETNVNFLERLSPVEAVKALVKARERFVTETKDLSAEEKPDAMPLENWRAVLNQEMEEEDEDFEGKKLFN